MERNGDDYVWRPNREFCLDSDFVVRGADPASPTHQWCSNVECFETDGDGTAVLNGLRPKVENLMSYYASCTGTYVVDGVRTEGFTSDQVAAIQRCRNLSERADLVDVCAGRGGDSDNDGHCDADGDGIPSACDVASSNSGTGKPCT